MSRQVSSELFRFELPSELEPEDDWCIKVHIPAHPDYLAILMSHLKALTFSRNFARDDTREGASLVSHRWEKALFNEPLIVGCGEDDMTTIRLRVKPGVPWISQFSYDEGVTWVDFLIQPNWSGNFSTVSPDLSDANAARDMAAAYIDNFYISIVQSIAQSIADGDTKGETVQHVYDMFNGYGAGASLSAGIDDVYDEYQAADPDVQSDMAEECVYFDCFQLLADFMQNDPFWIDHLFEFIGNELDCSVNNLFSKLTQLAIQLGQVPLYNYVANLGVQDGHGSNFAVDCGITGSAFGNDYVLIGPFTHYLVATPGDNPDGFFFHKFPKPSGWEIAAYHVTCYPNAPVGYSSAVMGYGYGYPPTGYTDIVPGVELYANQAAADEYVIGVRNTSVEDTTIFSLFGLDTDLDFDIGRNIGYGSGSAYPLGGFNVGWGDTVGSAQTRRTYLIFKLP